MRRGGGVAAAVAFGVAVAVLAGPVSEAATGNGFTFAPAFTQISVPAAQPKVQFGLELRNQSAEAQSFRINVVDFGSLDEEGGVAFLGAAASELEHQYGLSSWMAVDQPTPTVAPHGTVKLVLTIDNRESLAPGGHYGAVLATAIDAATGKDAEPRVGVKQVLSSLVLATKEGGLAPKLTLTSQSHDGGWGRLPGKVVQRFHNTGNVHVVPRGVAEVRDPAGRVVARGALNDASGAILPDSYRRYVTPLVGVGRAWLPGRYTVVTTYRFDGTDDTQKLTTGFWYAGSVVIVAVLLVTLMAVAALSWWMRRKLRR